MLGYLSLDIICSLIYKVYLKLCSCQTVRFSKQIMSADKYPSILSCQMEAIYVNRKAGFRLNMVQCWPDIYYKLYCLKWRLHSSFHLSNGTPPQFWRKILDLASNHMKIKFYCSIKHQSRNKTCHQVLLSQAALKHK